MEKRRLGKTEMMVTPIGFGGIPIQRLAEPEAITLVKEAVDRGINFIDSARGYTTSEERIGKALKGSLRDSVYLASKSMARDADGFRAEVESTLASMQTDYLDLYQFHNVRTADAWEKIIGPGGAMETAVKAKEAGLIRHIGISGHVADVLCDICGSGLVETIQVPFNPVESKPADRLLELANQNDLGIIVMKPLAGGALNRADLSLRWILQHPVTAAIPGMDSVAQVAENIAVGEDLRPLRVSEHEELDKIVSELGQDFCRRCEYCLPCPNGIDIPVVFIFEGYIRRYGLSDWARERYGAMAVRADACVECGECEARCPYDLPIKDKLKRAREVLE